MAETVPSLSALPADVPTRRMRRRLSRCVPLLAYEKGSPLTFLYTSGRPGRCNPASVRCLYFSETEEVAAEEYRLAWKGTPAEHQPKVTYQASVSLRRILDVEKTATLLALGLTTAGLAEPWRGRPLTRLQELGATLNRQTEVAAIRFPSDAARRRGWSGWNVAIFPAAIKSPDRLTILGPDDDPLEVLP